VNIFVEGMHGMGDCIRQRAIIRRLLDAGHEVWLTSSWVSIYQDFINATGRLHLLNKPTRLRTQTKNAKREAALFEKNDPRNLMTRLRIWYPPERVRKTGSVMAAMCEAAGQKLDGADFTFDDLLPLEWTDALLNRLQPFIDRINKPIMLYRPLVDRPGDWTGCRARNPDHEAYAALFEAVRDKFFVISVADLAPKVEWVVGKEMKADLYFHEGQLPFEELAALTKMSSMVYCSPGFAGVLAQAVGTPVACIFGGYERSQFFFAGRQKARCLGIDPINPCECFSHNHNCRKEINLATAIVQLDNLTKGI
jgi:hypothetical protein